MDGLSSPGSNLRASVARRRLLKASALLSTPALSLASLSSAGGAAGSAAGEANADDNAFWFGLVGDAPYFEFETGNFERVLAATGNEGLRFLIHIGDFKASTEACTDALFESRIALLDRSPHPLVYTPGDNEWTDCIANGNADPHAPGNRLDRLDWLRHRVFANADSLGRRRIRLERQAREFVGGPALPENQRWRSGSLQFCTLHAVGSNNGLSNRGGISRADVRREWSLRQQANEQWLADTVALARRTRAGGLAIALHANLRFERARDDGWRALRDAIIVAARVFDGPVLLMHGDTHRFRTDHLLAESHGLDRFVRVESFGFPFASSWVQIRWTPAAIDSADGPFLVSTRHL